ncbi:putative ABC transport system ATP-binding protein [Nitratiruptor sp. YY08-26]|uniref:ABC transporter ATP-binding protein n=1 Tax=unclassified Nitratiruptor TaxID=2624044 RepID=UPI001914FDB6|nr:MULTISPECIES: ABC transporter ATP-binding protein [unclassified Nitratiruptor]BCD61685.1 putative ABC transport system ATP-binding protein [Nitratiruptor sp. YY08-13]BCD65620.1 putative ABC transport system ATP-binding protein [Nitratiruptor sp. YY08-26]
MSAIISLEKVSKIYNLGTAKEVVALKDVSLQIKRSSLVLLMGPSGSGKSTLLSLIAALTRPTSGKVVVDGQTISKLPDRFAAAYRREKIGFIFQKFNLLEDLTVFENVIVPLIPTPTPLKELEQMAHAVMERFAIAHKKDMVVRKLSGGEQQRCAIARALIDNPPIILADEPTANLDSALTEQFLQILGQLKQEGKTIVIATHDPRFADLEIVDEIYEVREGNVFLS